MRPCAVAVSTPNMHRLCRTMTWLCSRGVVMLFSGTHSWVIPALYTDLLALRGAVFTAWS
eukprot:707219-Rhodomonas_salina.2